MTSKSKRRGLFVVLDGIDGSGTTTQGDLLTDFIRAAHEQVIFTNEPSNGPAGSMIRLAITKRIVGAATVNDEALKEDLPPSLDDRMFALLFAADRMDHLTTQIIPALRSGRHVVCDRYVLSSLAYQGLTVDPDWLMEVNRFAMLPDLTLLLDVPAAVARKRMSDTRLAKDLFEEEEQLRRVRDQYLEMVKRFGPRLGRVEVIDGTEAVWRVKRVIWKFVEQLLNAGPQTGSANEDLF
jgi:dTMP kinase